MTGGVGNGEDTIRLFLPIRDAVTGKLVGRELDTKLKILGLESIAWRIERVTETLRGEEK